MPHIHEHIDFTVEVFIVYNNRVLLRKHDKYNIWLSVGGHIELNEDPIETAIREVKEEVGLDIELIGNPKALWGASKQTKELLPPKFLNRNRVNDHHEHVTLVYFARALNDRVVTSGDDQSAEWKWLTREELERDDDHLQPDIRLYAQCALKELGTV